MQASTSSSPASIPSQPTDTVQWDPKKSWRHMAAGAVGGMTGAIITAPLDVVKTRLQSSLFNPHPSPQQLKSIPYSSLASPSSALSSASSAASSSKAPSAASSAGIPSQLQEALGSQASKARAPPRTNLLWNFVETTHIIRDISRNEGTTALWKGIGPTLVGTIPARSIQFFTYGNMKQIVAQHFNGGREATWVHLVSAGTAGVVTGFATNPIWVVKTRMQLSQRARRLAPSAPLLAPSTASSSTSASFLSMQGPPSAVAGVGPASGAMKPQFTNGLSCAKFILQTEGVKGLYKGLSASMLGVSELIIQWAVYERFKRMGVSEKGGKLGEWTGVLGAAGGAKMLAALITYPHEVLRTRLRQPALAGGVRKYFGLVQTLKLVVAEEGVQALYGGLTPHLMRVVPNAAAMYSVYELAVRW